MADALQIVGALLILVPFAALQLERLRPNSATYLWLNLLGSALLSALALAGEQWGFLLLEACWALVAGWGLVKGSRAPAH
jgi:hypothetical protein